MPVTLKRLPDQPIIHQGLSAGLGRNINGPSLIRVPDWVPDPLGRYYLYFAHHEGRSIRLAYADEVTGPWRIHEPGALRLEDSLFPYDRAQITPAQRPEGDIATMGISYYYPHIASPDVLVDADNRRILMYVHGMVEDGGQKTRLTLSGNGLDFTPQPELIDHYYFRVFPYQGWYWALSWGGYLYRAARPEGPFERGPALFEGAPLCPPGTILRHLGLLRDGSRLHIFFTRIGDAPEVILHAEARLSPDWHDWQVAPPCEVLRPEAEWEGALLPPVQSGAGTSHRPEHALRDPCVFRDADGQTYLLYCGAGEQAIGIASLSL